MKRISQVSAQSVEPTLQKYKVQIVELQKTNDDLTKLHSEIAKQNSDLKSKISELEVKKEEIKELEIKLAVLEQNLKGKDEMIVVLKSRTSNGESIEDPNRPKMGSVFIDPLSSNSGEGLKSFIRTDDVTREEKDEMKSKVNKLKGLLGKLPVRRQED
jgi:predicted RNase H-like nuclease (RuvC/YqgF family)